MSTCFLPVAADLRVGDEVLGVGDQVFDSPHTVIGVEPTGSGVRLVTVRGGLAPGIRRLLVGPDATVDLAPPF